MSVLDKAVDKFVALYPMVDVLSGGLSSTLSSAIVAGAVSIPVASGTNSANGDDVRIGSGETMEIFRISSGGGTTTLVPVKPLKFDHASAEPVVEQQALVLGPPETDGFKLSVNGETVDVFVATQALAWGVLTGYVDITANMRFPVPTIDVLALALGIPRAKVIGDGTAAAQTGTVGPRMFTTDGVLFGAITNVNLIATFVRKDGSYAKLDLYNVSFDPTVVSTVFGRGLLAAIPLKVMASSGAFDFTNSLWTPAVSSTTNQFSQGDLFSEITDVQTLTDSGTTTTTTGTIAADAYVIPCTSVTGIVANDIVRLDAGDLVEYHIVHSVVSLNLNLRTQVFRAHGTGVVVTKQTRTTVGGIKGGFKFGMSGSVSTLRAENFRVSLGYKAGSIACTFGFDLISVTPEALQLAWGIPSSAYGSSVLPLGNKIGSSPTATLLFNGVSQNAKSMTMIGWAGSVQIGGETTFSQSVDSVVPVLYKPKVIQALINV